MTETPTVWLGFLISAIIGVVFGLIGCGLGLFLQRMFGKSKYRNGQPASMSGETYKLYHSCDSQCRGNVHALLVRSEFDDTTVGGPGDVIRFDLTPRVLKYVDYYRVTQPIPETRGRYNHMTVYDVQQSNTADYAYVVFVRIADTARVQFLPEVEKGENHYN